MSKPYKVLLTQNQLCNYSGSEIVTIELAEYFSARGSQVTVLTTVYGDPIATDFNKFEGVKVVIFGSDEAKDLQTKYFDLIWVHHQLLTSQLINELALSSSDDRLKPLTIFNHMSSSEHLEYPVMYDVEKNIADLVLFNSPETKDKIHESGANFNGVQQAIFANPAPDIFLRPKTGKNNRAKLKALKTVAVVSNHPPEEILDAAGILSEDGINVTIFGRVDNGKIKRVNPELISGYDVIVTIGKTVQYCLTNEKPVYCYDRFGGPGYLSSRNFATAQYHNFSGRGFFKKNAETIANEIKQEYQSSLDEIVVLHKKNVKDFLLSKVLPKIISANKRTRKTGIKNVYIESFRRSIEKRSEIFAANQRNTFRANNLKVKNEEMHILLREKNQDLIKMKEEEQRLRKELKAIKNSKYYKIYKKATKVVRRSES